MLQTFSYENFHQALYAANSRGFLERLGAPTKGVSFTK